MPVNITDVDAFTDPVVAPDDGDDADGAIFQIGLQGLANRTRHHKVILDAFPGGNNAWTGTNSFSQNISLNGAANEANYGAARARKDYVLPPVNADWIQFSSSDAQSRCTSAGKSVSCRIKVPRQCTLTNVLVQVSSSGLGGNVAISLTRLTPNTVSGASGAPTAAFIASGNNAGVSGYHGIPLNGLSELADEVSLFYLNITSSSGADISNPDTIHSIMFQYNDVGPRNG